MGGNANANDSMGVEWNGNKKVIPAHLYIAELTPNLIFFSKKPLNGRLGLGIESDKLATDERE